MALFISIFLPCNLFADDQAICVDVQEGLQKSSGNNAINSISPAISDAYALIIYVSFPNTPGDQNLPGYTSDIETNNQEFFEEMSYGSHSVHTTTTIRPNPNQALCYIADHDDSYYRECFRFINHTCQWQGTGGLALLINEIFDKVHTDNPTAFKNPNDPTKEVEMVFVNVSGGNLFARHSAYASLGSHGSPHYSGTGTTQEFWSQDVLEWSIAHEYAHQLGLPHPPNNDEYKYYGMYALMHNQHQVNQYGDGGANPISVYNLHYRLN